MRTTLNIDDDLYRRTKAAAALRGCSVTSVIEEALRLALSQATTSAVRPVRVLPEADGPFAGIDLADSRGLAELQDQGRPLDAVR